MCVPLTSLRTSSENAYGARVSPFFSASVRSGRPAAKRYGARVVIARHNRYYPMESRLPMDPRTGDFVRIDGRPYRRRPLDSAWILERFPPVRRVA